VSEAKPLDRAALEAHPLPPVIDGDKESKGRLLVVAGSAEVPGAAILAAVAGLRAGAGKLRIATSQSVAAQIGVGMPEAMVIALPEDGDGLAASAANLIGEEAHKVDAVVAGPGMDQGGACEAIAEALLGSEARLALDAALLRSLKAPEHARSPTPVLLPHAKELAALLDCDERAVDDDPRGCGLEAAQRYRSLVLVKGVTSHVVTPEGATWTHEGGSPGLGVSGSGDVLAGIVGGLLSALLWAVWLHGEAGARLGQRVGPIGFLAREIAGEIPALLPR
jgi:ADP-dependent NAD(P)H-hydrate dehydratase